ncbi:BTAD domain-containing putative transcriptional regulator, partial [Phytoactinopolyspora endophytica]|uniref:BTAD domain-containing putative transcriptional regulator n=1 Tax=Phytoactinopolyspora endophytica TaxID=1642495 RepID=UPI0013EDD1E8
MRVGILGPLQVWAPDGRPIEVGAGRPRALLARLALDPGRAVSVDALVDALWEDSPPSGVANSLQSVVSRLRRSLQNGAREADAPELAAGSLAGSALVAAGDAPGIEQGAPAIRNGATGIDAGLTIESRAAGYVLTVAESDVDWCKFEQCARQGREALRNGEVEAAHKLLSEALALWRGPVLADLGEASFAEAAAVRLDEARLSAIEDRNEAALLLGRHADVVAELNAMAADYPLRERICGLLIRALAGVGRQAEAVAAYERTRRRLDDELGLDPSEELQDIHLAALRGELAAVGPWNTGARPAATEPPVPPQPAAAPDTTTRPSGQRVPSRLTSFVGRDDEVEALITMLKETRLITLHGPGGAGKTRLAIEAARRLMSDGVADGEVARDDGAGDDVAVGDAHDALAVGADGVWFVELAPVGNVLDVAPAVLTALGLGEKVSASVDGMREELPAAHEASRRLVDVLTDKSAVLVLDNCEHLVEAVAALGDALLSACPELRLVTTSREPLGVGGEQLYPVGPLDLPADGAVAGAEEAYSYAAVRLFAERAAAVRPGFRIDERTARPVVEICQRLDGMPLAIELAAARVRVLSPEQIAGRLDDRFRLLTNGGRTALGRHQTLRAVVEWSWELLDKPERTLLQRMAVFSGGASLDAVESICAGDGVAVEDVLDTIASLVGKSLVEAVASSSGTEVRYRLLETVKAYAGERLVDADEAEPTGAAHACYFRDLLERADPHLRRSEQVEWMSRLAQDYDNLLTGLRWAIQHSDAELAVRMAAVLGYYWLLRGTTQEGGSWLRDTLAVPAPRPLAQRALVHIYEALSCFSDSGMATMMRGMARARWVCRQAGEDATSPVYAFVEALWVSTLDGRPEVRHRLDPARQSPDAWLRGIGHMAGMFMASAISDVRTRDSDLASALAEFRSVGDRMGTAFALRMRAT